MDTAAARINADPISLGAALQALVGCATVLGLGPLRSRRSALGQAGGVALTIFGLSAITALFVLTVRSGTNAAPWYGNSSGQTARPARARMAWDRDTGVWTIVREVRPSVWIIVTSALLCLLYLHAVLLILVTPAARRWPRAKTLSNDPPPSTSSARSAQRARRTACDLNRVWVNICVLLVACVITGVFGGIVVSSRKAVRVGTSVSSAAVRKEIDTNIPLKTEPLQSCVCSKFHNVPKNSVVCSKLNKGVCIVAWSQRPYNQAQLWQCMLNVRNASSAVQAKIADSIDTCVREKGSVVVAKGFASAVAAVIAVSSVLLVLFTASRRPLIYTATFTLTAYLVVVLVLLGTLAVLFTAQGMIGAVYAMELDQVQLVVATGEAAIRLMRIAVACLYSQLCITICAAATEAHKIEWSHTMYDLLQLRKNNDDYDRERDRNTDLDLDDLEDLDDPYLSDR